MRCSVCGKQLGPFERGFFDAGRNVVLPRPPKYPGTYNLCREHAAEVEAFINAMKGRKSA